jgi:antitoxin component YwqK of YwqJK toxin-antitoxin module
MKNILIFLFVFGFLDSFSQLRVNIDSLFDRDGIMFYGGKPFTGVSFDQRGDFLKEESTWKKGRKEGLQVEYFNNKVQRKYFYKSLDSYEVLDSLYEVYDNGELQMRTTYKMGKKNGLYEEYFSDKSIQKKCYYKLDQLDGLYESYRYDRDSNRIWLEEKINYKMGNRDGPYIIYHSKGKIKDRGTFKMDYHEGLREMFFETGELELKEYYKDGKEKGLHELYDKRDDGKVILIIKYFVGDSGMEGLYEEYHTNGNLKIKCYYKGGDKDGPYEEYSEDGRILVKGKYIKGELITEG